MGLKLQKLQDKVKQHGVANVSPHVSLSAVTWAGMVPLFLRMRGSFSEWPSRSLLNRSKGFPCWVYRVGRMTVTRGRVPSPTISNTRPRLLARLLQRTERARRAETNLAATPLYYKATAEGLAGTWASHPEWPRRCTGRSAWPVA